MVGFNCQLATPRFTWSSRKGLSRLSWPVGMLSVGGSLDFISWCEKTQAESGQRHSLGLGAGLCVRRESGLNPKLRAFLLAPDHCFRFLPPSLPCYHDWDPEL